RYSSRALRAQAGRLLATATTWSLAMRLLLLRLRFLQLYRLLAPELFQVVVAAHRRVHDVHDDVAEVDQHPLAVPAALDAVDARADLLHRFLHARGERVHLPVGVAARDHHALEVGGLARDVVDHDVAALDVLECGDDGAL